MRASDTAQTECYLVPTSLQDYTKLGVMAQLCNPSTQEVKIDHEFRVILGYTAVSCLKDKQNTQMTVLKKTELKLPLSEIRSSKKLTIPPTSTALVIEMV